MAAALERGDWSAARPGRTLPPGKPFLGGKMRPGRAADQSPPSSAVAMEE